MEQIEISKFRTTCLSVLDRVAQTRKPVLVTRRGKPIAKIVPPAPSAAGSWLGSMKGSVTIHSDIVAPDPSVADTVASWSPPVSDTAGWRGLGPEAVRAAAIDDLDRRLSDTGGGDVETAEGTDHDVD